MKINQLSENTSVVSSDQFPISSNGSTRRVSASTLLAYVQNNFSAQSETGNLAVVGNGFFDYNDLTTQGTPISLTANVYSDLTNDTAGLFTNRTYPPPGITDVWNKLTNRFDFTQLALGDQIDFRIDLIVTTTSPNQTVTIDMDLGIGSTAPYTLNIISERQYKSSGTKQIVAMFGIYMGDEITRANPSKLKIKSDNTATVKVNGWYCRILRRPTA